MSNASAPGRSRFFLRAAASVAAVTMVAIGCENVGFDQRSIETISLEPRPVRPEAVQAEDAPERPMLPPVRGRLAERLEPVLMRHREMGATLSARVLDAETGEELYARESDRAMIPASNMKLPVSAAALEFFGPTQTFDTFCYVAGDDLWLVGTGDPATGDPQIAEKKGEAATAIFDTWADELLARGLTHFPGRVRYWDGSFDREMIHPSWGRDDLQYWYAAPISGLNFHDNCIDIFAEPAAEVGQPATLRAVPASSLVTLVNRTTTTQPSGANDAGHRRPQMQNVFEVSGTIAKPGEVGSAPVVDPGAFFADAMVQHLRSRGITVAAGIEPIDAMPIAPPPGVTPTLLSVHRTKITDVLWRVNKNSQNLLAEGLAKLLGRAYLQKQGDAAAVGSWPAAREAVEDFFLRHRIDPEQFVLADGSGLSRENRVTTDQISGLLLAMHRSPHREAFHASLAEGGVDGTIRRRFTDLPGRVHAKTGYIGGVRSLSGYVETDTGRTLIFAFIYNQIPRQSGGIRDTAPYEELQDEALRLLMDDDDLPGPTSKPATVTGG